MALGSWIDTLVLITIIRIIYLSRLDGKPAYKSNHRQISNGHFSNRFERKQDFIYKCNVQVPGKRFVNVDLRSGHLMALEKTGQALHDKLTGCVVLSKE